MNLPASDAPIAYIVDDDPEVSEGISDYLDAKGIASCCFDRCERFLDLWQDNRPGCLILDYQLPELSGLELQQRLIHNQVEIPVIFMTAHSSVPVIRAAMKAGAVEFLCKPFAMEELLLAVRQAFAKDIVRHKQQAEEEELRNRIALLTPRESQVLAAILAGLLNKQIAAQLKISEAMVKQHRHQVMLKMHADSSFELIKKCAAWQDIKTKKHL